jgi:DNA-binding response OmpR family regulator
MARGKILVVEDDQTTVDLVKNTLDQQGYEVVATATGEEALEYARNYLPDLIILDINLDGPSSAAIAPMDGIEVLRQIRKDSDACVLMLTATSIGYVKVAAFSVGADDYLTKPFDPKELAARVDAILRRARGASVVNTELAFQRLRIDPAARIVWKDGVEVKLTPIEFDLLHTLARKRGQVLHRGQLISNAWDYKYTGDERLVDVHMGRLRKKIEDDASDPKFILTVWGKGYRFEANPV